MDDDSLREAWRGFVSDVISRVRVEWLARREAPVVWQRQPSGAYVTDLDIRIDVAARAAFCSWFGDSPCFSEELGMMGARPSGATYMGVLDPIDGTESLIAGTDDWWFSFGLLQSSASVAGLLFQPARDISYDSAEMKASPTKRTGTLGLSPASIDAGRKLDGEVALVSVPHSVNKVTAVLEGRCDAAAYVPTAKSPHWRSWDLAGASAVARSGGVVLRGLDGRSITFDEVSREEERTWICARDEETFRSSEPLVRQLTQLLSR